MSSKRERNSGIQEDRTIQKELTLKQKQLGLIISKMPPRLVEMGKVLVMALAQSEVVGGMDQAMAGEMVPTGNHLRSGNCFGSLRQ
jgi:hypothetical protein